jgi:prolipoprotein diacylglyceryltransferase
MIILQTHPIFFSFVGLKIYAHALFFVLGALIGWWVLEHLNQGLEKKLANSEWFVFWVFATALGGARLGYFLIYPSALHTVSQILAIWQGGLVSYTAIITGLLAAYWWVRKWDRLAQLKLLDALVLSTLLAWGIGRLGNYYAGDSEGVYSVYWSWFYSRVPIQLLESLWCFILYLFFRFKYKSLKPGSLSRWAMVGYFTGRFFIDIWRNENYLWVLHNSQWASLALVLILIFTPTFYRFSKKPAFGTYLLFLLILLFDQTINLGLTLFYPKQIASNEVRYFQVFPILTSLFLAYLLIFWLFKLAQKNKTKITSLQLALIGLIGNTITFLVYGHFIDYLIFPIWNTNLDDFFIVVGLIYFVLQYYFEN